MSEKNRSTSPPTARGYLSPTPPEPGFETGRRLLAECPEFTLYELHRRGGRKEIVRSEAVERAYWKATFRISDREVGSLGSEDQRIEWAAAVLKLAEYSNYHPLESLRRISGFASPLEGAVDAASALASTIGQNLKSLHEIDDIDKIHEVLEDCSARFKGAIRAYAASTWMLPDKRAKTRSSREEALITHAEMIFLHSHTRPTKSEIRKIVESLGISFSGKNAEAHWADSFNKAALGDLPL
ncbi:MAG: hypothetical protein EOP09_09235 [Proteobacteria bacterium]|nr:MAG: hypothetical protein EOP09_09235 [Pseudomonadota bacterium]